MRQFFKFKYVLFVILITYFSVSAMIHKGLLPSHDGESQIVRFYEFDKVLRDGDIFPRWAPDLNQSFGIPLFNYVYPFPNYVASFLHLFGLSFIDTFKLSMFFAAIIGGIFFYLWSKEFWGNLGGLVSSVFYSFSPYHFVDLYIRGSIGEVWALAFFPAFLWAYTKFVKSKRRVFLLFSSIFLALIVFSHNILALMFFIFSLSYISLLIYKENNKKILILNTLYLIFLGLGLSAIFWAPAIYETKYATGLQIFDVTSHFPDLYQLLIPTWGSGFSGAGMQNELSYQIGIANLLAIFLTTTVIFLQIKKRNKKLPFTLFFYACFIFVFFLMLSVSKPIWQIVPFMNYFQFPWRLLSLEILFTSFLAGSIFSLNIKSKFIRLFFAAFLIFVVFIFGIGYAKPAYYMYRDDNYYVGRSNFIDGTNSPGNVFNTIWMNGSLKKQKNKVVFAKGNGKIKLGVMKSTSYNFNILAEKNSEIIINTAYFPGWISFIDGKQVAIKSNKDGLIILFVPKGEHSIKLKFSNTNIRKFAEIWSLISIILTIVMLVKLSYVKIKR